MGWACKRLKVPRFLGGGSGRLYTPETGRIEFDGEDLLARAPHEISALGIARSFQNLGLFPSLSVRENVMLGAYSRARSGFLASTLRPLSTTSTRACAQGGGR